MILIKLECLYVSQSMPDEAVSKDSKEKRPVSCKKNRTQKKKKTDRFHPCILKISKFIYLHKVQDGGSHNGSKENIKF